MGLRVQVELSGENLPLARAELAGALRALQAGEVPSDGPSRWVTLDLAGADAVGPLATRLALARRIVRDDSYRSLSEAEAEATEEAGRNPAAASFRAVGDRTILDGEAQHRIAEAWRRGGGRISLARPGRTFLLDTDREGVRLREVLATIDRRRFDERRMPKLPFQRPVSLVPRLGRVAVNLASVARGDRVADPFCGTGSLLVESALLGATVVGIDRDPAMIRGAHRNLSHLGLPVEQLIGDDAADAAARFEPGTFDALVTDPPYGRASTSFGEAPADLLPRVLRAWSDRLSDGARIVVVGPDDPGPFDSRWHETGHWPDRVHRSLTRVFRRYERIGTALSSGAPA